MRDLRHADVGIGQHRLGGLDVVARQVALRRLYVVFLLFEEEVSSDEASAAGKVAIVFFHNMAMWV